MLSLGKARPPETPEEPAAAAADQETTETTGCDGSSGSLGNGEENVKYSHCNLDVKAQGLEWAFVALDLEFRI